MLWHILIIDQKGQQAISGATLMCGICTTEAIQRLVGVDGYRNEI